MATYKDLMAQREALEQQIKQVRETEISGAIANAREIIAEFGLTQADLFGGSKRSSAAKGGKVAAKYRDPATGATWTGRGKAPRWIQNEDRGRFAIPE